MELTAAIALLTAALTPFIVAVFTRPDLTPARKRLIAGAVAVALAVIVAVATRAIEGVPLEWSAWTGRFLIALGVIVSMAQGFYRAFKDAVDAVEGGVSLPRRAMPGGGV